MKRILLIFCAFAACIASRGQNGNNPGPDRHTADSLAAAAKDSLKMAKLTAAEYFPVIHAGIYSGVLPVEGVDEIPDPRRQYRLLFEFTMNFQDSTHEKSNPGLTEIARILNLHVASGIAVSHLHFVVVVHGPALRAIENNGAWQAAYHRNNPDSDLIAALMKNGVKFVACGQAMNFLDIKKSQLFPGVKVSLTAQTAFSNYAGQGYAWYKIDDEDK